MFSVSILNQKMRNITIAWKSLEYIFYLSMIQSQADAKGQSQDLKAERLHAIFKVVLATLVDAQKDGALDNVSLIFGNHTKRVNLKLVTEQLFAPPLETGKGTKHRPQVT